MNLRDYSGTFAHGGGGTLGGPCPDVTNRKHVLKTRLERKNGCAHRRSSPRQNESFVVDVHTGA